MLRIEGEGVTSIIRCLGLPPNDYYNLLHFFHSSAFAIEPLCRYWMSLVFQIAPTLSVKDRPVYLFDAIKVGKSGKKMPGVKMLHQESEDNTKAEFIMGHFWGALSLLCGSGQRAFAIPLRLQLQDGLKRSPSEKATLTDKMHKLVIDSGVEAGLVVADSYYSCQAVLQSLTDAGFHYLGAVRKTTVAYHLPPPKEPGRPGRPRKYGQKVKLADLFGQRHLFSTAWLPLYGNNQQVRLYAIDLLWQGFFVRFVLSVAESGRRAIFLCTDRTMSAEHIVATYSTRFTIESGFKALVHRVFAFCYRFWMRSMKKLAHGSGNQYLHRAGDRYRRAVLRKVEAYERHVNLAAIAMGMLELLSLTVSPQLWNLGGLYFRTSPVSSRPTVHGVRLCLQGEVIRVFRKNERFPLLAKILSERDRGAPSDHPYRILT